MRKIGFIGCYDKTDLIIYIAKILVTAGKKVLVVDNTVSQKAKYIVPVIKPTVSYITDFEGIDVAVGLHSFESVRNYLGLSEETDLNYDIALIDVDTPEGVEAFEVENAEKNYFVTSFDAYSLKKGLEALSGLKKVQHLTKILFSRTVSTEEDDYLNYLSLGYKIEWDEEKIYFPLVIEDLEAIAENQRVSKIKFKKLTPQYKNGLMYISSEILEKDKYSDLKKIFKQLEKGA